MSPVLRRALPVAALLVSTDAILLADRWVPIGPPGGAYASRIVVDPSAPATLYVAFSYPSTYLGVYKSVNSGASWIPAKTGLESTQVAALVIDPKQPLTLYAGGTGVAPAGNTVGRGIFKSTDGGKSWAPVNDGLEDLFINALAIDPQDPSVLYAGTNRGISRTRDGGATWVPLLPSGAIPSGPVRAIAIDPVSPNTIYASTDGGLIKTSDGGLSWNFMNDGLTNRYLSEVLVNPASPSTILAISSSTGVIFKTEDGGQVWRPIRSGLPETFIRALAVSPLFPLVVYAGTDKGLYLSGDWGSTWAPLDELGLSSVISVALDPYDGLRIYAGTTTGVFRSGDGGATWVSANEGISARYAVVALAPEARGNLYVGTGSGEVFKSPDGGRSWTAASLGTGTSPVRALVVDPTTPTTLYAGGNTVWKSLDASETWSSAGSGLDRLFVTALAIDPTDPATLYVGTDAGLPNFPRIGGGIFKSTDAGRTWSAASSGLERCAGCSYPVVSAIAIDPGRSSTVYAIALDYRGGLFKSVDRGANWSRASEIGANALAIDPRSSSTLYADGFRSTDGGATWTATSLASSDVYALTIDIRSGVVYAGTLREGVFRSLDQGETWTPVGEGLEDSPVISLALDPSGSALYAGTSSGGVFRLFLRDRRARPRTVVAPSRKP